MRRPDLPTLPLFRAALAMQRPSPYGPRTGHKAVQAVRGQVQVTPERGGDTPQNSGENPPDHPFLSW